MPLLLMVVLVTAVEIQAPRSAGADPGTDETQQSTAPSCQNSCRGLGIKKVQAGEEHCGPVPRETKDEALDAACALAESHREELQRTATTRAREKCAEEGDRADCLCTTKLRSWQNVYTHVLSQNCWTECGRAALVECDRHRAADAD